MSRFTDEQQASIARDPDDGVDARRKLSGADAIKGADAATTKLTRLKDESSGRRRTVASARGSPRSSTFFSRRRLRPAPTTPSRSRRCTAARGGEGDRDLRRGGDCRSRRDGQRAVSWLGDQDAHCSRPKPLISRTLGSPKVALCEDCGSVCVRVQGPRCS